MGTASARPESLASYRARMAPLDSQLKQAVAELDAALRTFQARSPEFLVDDGSLVAGFRKHVTNAEHLDDWVGQVGDAFRAADSGDACRVLVQVGSDEAVALPPDKDPDDWEWLPNGREVGFGVGGALTETAKQALNPEELKKYRDKVTDLKRELRGREKLLNTTDDPALKTRYRDEITKIDSKLARAREAVGKMKEPTDALKSIARPGWVRNELGELGERFPKGIARAGQEVGDVAKWTGRYGGRLGFGLTAVNAVMDLEDGKSVGRVAAETTGAVAGGYAGGVIGTFLIPIPGVGTAVGSVVGNVVGSYVGGKLGDMFADSHVGKEVGHLGEEAGHKVGHFVSGLFD